VTIFVIGGFALIRRLMRSPAPDVPATTTLASKPTAATAAAEVAGAPTPATSSTADPLPSAETPQNSTAPATRRPRKGFRSAPKGPSPAPASKRDEDYGRFE